MAHVLVFGDIMVDRYHYGRARGIAQESPATVFEEQEVVNQLGAAANVAVSLRNLGHAVTLSGYLCADEDAHFVSTELRIRKIVNAVMMYDGHTELKQRWYQDEYELFRCDWPAPPPAPEVRGRLASLLRAVLNAEPEKFLGMEQERQPIDAVVISDYGKHAVSSETMQPIRQWYVGDTHRPIMVIDPHPRNVVLYPRAFLTPNHIEAVAMLPGALEAHYGYVVTRGREGMEVFYNDGTDAWAVKTHIAGEERPVCSVGAGDVVAAVCCHRLLDGATWTDATATANEAAHCAVLERGTSHVTKAMLCETSASST